MRVPDYVVPVLDCTALTSLGIEPPEIDFWAVGEATGRTRAERRARA